MIRKILVVVDGSRASDEAIDYSIRMAKKNGQHLILLYILEKVPEEIDAKGDKLNGDNSYLKSRIDEAIRLSAPSIWTSGVSYSTHIEAGEPTAKILEVANKMEAEMIVIGFVWLKGVAKLKALTSGSRTVVEMSEIPVLMVPAGLRSSSRIT